MSKNQIFHILNGTDFKIIYLLGYQSQMTISDLTKQLGISGVNTWKHLKKLKQLTIITIAEARRGEKKYPKLNNTSPMVPKIHEAIKLLAECYTQLGCIDFMLDIQQHRKEVH